ncbi:MAG: DUF2752 domain-containing protein [Acidobacteriota bacterium]
MRWRAPDREERQIAWLWAVLVVCALLLRPFWLALAPLLPGCPFRALTGVPCPSCGTTRAAVALLGGHALLSLADNPLAAVAGVGFLAGGLLAPLWVSLGGRVPELPRPLPRWVRLALVAALAANWAWVILA